MKLDVPDVASFLYSFHEVFVEEILRFPSDNDAPRILDCGANIGMTALYFRRLHKRARITAFEADPKIAGVLRKNLATNDASDVEVVEAVLWDSSEEVPFYSDGADAGRVGSMNGKEPVWLRGTRLRDWLSEPIDFLKLDVEGAETRILPDIADRLCHVHRMFVEYHSFDNKPQRLGESIGLLEDIGFRVHVRPVWTSSNPYEEVRSQMGMDLQLNVFAWRNNR